MRRFPMSPIVRCWALSWLPAGSCVGGARFASWGDPDVAEMAFSVTKSVVAVVQNTRRFPERLTCRFSSVVRPKLPLASASASEPIRKSVDGRPPRRRWPECGRWDADRSRRPATQAGSPESGSTPRRHGRAGRRTRRGRRSPCPPGAASSLRVRVDRA